MPAFSEKHSQEAKTALFHAVLDGRTRVTAALRAAAAGQLAGVDRALQAEIAAIPYGYAARLVQDERHRRAFIREHSTDVADVARQAAASAVNYARDEIAKIERKKGKGPGIAGDYKVVLELLERALKLQRATEEKAPAPITAPTEPKTPKQPQGFVARLAAGAETEDDEQSTEPQEEPLPMHGDADAPRTTSTTNEQNARSAGPVRLRVAASAEKNARRAAVARG